MFLRQTMFQCRIKSPSESEISINIFSGKVMLNEENLRRAFLEKNNDFKKNTLEYFFNAENHWKY